MVWSRKGSSDDNDDNNDVDDDDDDDDATPPTRSQRKSFSHSGNAIEKFLLLMTNHQTIISLSRPTSGAARPRLAKAGARRSRPAAAAAARTNY